MRLRVLPEARDDEIAAAEHYDFIRPELGQRFLAELRAQVRRIADSPLLYPLIYRQFRATRIRKFPYRVVYFADPKEIVICAIFHTGRDPAALKSRLDEIDE